MTHQLKSDYDHNQISHHSQLVSQPKLTPLTTYLTTDHGIFMLTTPKHLAAITACRSERQLQRAAASGRLVADHKKISCSWIISQGRPLDPDLIGSREAAQQLHITQREVQRRCKEGILDARKVGGVWLIKLQK